MVTDEYGLARYPWEKQTGETAKAFAAFIVYRDMGRDRTLRKASIQYYDIPETDFDPNGGKIRNIERWSATHRWVARAEAYDGWMQSLADAADADQVVQMRKRHANIASALQGKIAVALTQMSDDQLARLSLTDLTRVLEGAARVERMARGEPDSITQLNGEKELPGFDAPVNEEALLLKLGALQSFREARADHEETEDGTESEE